MNGSKSFLLLCLVFFLAFGMALSVRPAQPGVAGKGMSPDQSLQLLLEGNKRFVESKLQACGENMDKKRRELQKGQRPHAVVLSCSDSRVPPEIIFDQGLGEIFVVRVAGNIADPAVLGSIEYAVGHLGTSLVMVMGHDECGAVVSSFESGSNAEGNIGLILEQIAPSVRKAKESGKSSKALIDAAIDNHIEATASSLRRLSPVIAGMEKSGKVRLVKARYKLGTGEVVILE